jgi:preprotein translocase subunit SecF
MRNIYEGKHYKLLILVPLVLLFVSLYFIPKIQLDSSLAGGVSISFSTTSTVSVQNLTKELSAHIPNTQVSKSSLNGVTSLLVTFPANSSITAGSASLLDVYGWYSNYTVASVAIASLQSQLAAQPGNATAKAGLTAWQANQTRDLAAIGASLNSELSNLRPVIGSSYSLPYNASSAASMQSAAQAAYSNATTAYKTRLVSLLGSYVQLSNYSYNDVTATLGSYFLAQVRNIIIVAFILVAIAVFFIFRTPIPSLAVVFGAANDIIVALGAMGAFHIPLGIASVGGILMLIGFSIDTDMLSSIRILKRSEGTPTERAMSTFKTGVTMTSTAIISFATLFAISYFAFITTYVEISGVVLFGLLADIFTTWFGTTVMVVWYKRRRDRV